MLTSISDGCSWDTKVLKNIFFFKNLITLLASLDGRTTISTHFET